MKQQFFNWGDEHRKVNYGNLQIDIVTIVNCVNIVVLKNK